MILKTFFFSISISIIIIIQINTIIPLKKKRNKYIYY
jgi:hypothetical protein